MVVMRSLSIQFFWGLHLEKKFVKEEGVGGARKRGWLAGEETKR